MELGPFALSLAVQDIAASRKFYESLGFEAYDDHQDQGWMILKNAGTTIGLFQGMFERNLLTFVTPDVRAVQKQLKANGLTLTAEADEATTGPAHLTLEDPDGNPILLDQHDPEYTPTSG
jgi:catechol 2,3-dioxygenase-like lactoylglutathione lyase family enzyme